ncbi:uncharacterized protein EI97DRAFT_372791 [Westerdykella ornata]|uniref:Exonuclease domain-containing protein n=1 Tax=Westerdykella ornata TaxID=318751 RepID=A0A6A6JPI7_WESOR|nr:uncharacterized protein EI97DRAFT_372791 [Westerdykella ornata]KAF2278165.1 hypothetical protein EI97DRAFT_372791 [Westerdykella ornata]
MGRKTEKRHDGDGHNKDTKERYPTIEYSHNYRLRSQVRIADLQGLVLYLLADGPAPQWVAVKHSSSIRQVVVLMVPGLELGMFTGDISLALDQPSGSEPNENGKKQSGSSFSAHHGIRRKPLVMSPDDYYPRTLKRERLPDPLKPLSDIFPHVWPVVGTGEYRGKDSAKQFYRLVSPMQTMLVSPLPQRREEKWKSKERRGPTQQKTEHWENKRTPIIKYIVSLEEQRENNIVPHPAWFITPEAKEAAQQRRRAAGQMIEDGWVDSAVSCLEDGEVPEKDIESGSLTAGRQIIAIDCEMCLAAQREMVLTRISLVDWDGKTILDELVKPDLPIEDYVTQFSGITEEMLKNVTTSLSDIQQKLLTILTPRTILVGHSLESDLNALKFTHPFLVDTSIAYPHPNYPTNKHSLKWLCQKFLKGREIQQGSKGHDSIEDALACLDLVKEKCERGPAFGTAATNTEPIFKRLARSVRNQSADNLRAGALVDWGFPKRGYGGSAQIAIGCRNDEEVVAGIESAVKGQAVGESGATEQVNFVWGRLRELEILRGWWDETKSDDVEEMRQEALKRLGRPITFEEDEVDEVTEVSSSELAKAVASTVDNIAKVYDSLPRGTAFIVYSGSGDPREIRRLSTMQRQHHKEMRTKDWDDRTVKWTDTETQALSDAILTARQGISFVKVK